MDTTADTPRSMGDHNAPHLSPVTPAEDFRTVLINNVSWGAVLAGSVVAIILQVILNVLGIAVGAASIETAATTDTMIRSAPIGAAIWWTVSGIISAYAGAFTAGRLCGRPKETTGGWHGVTSWAVTMLLVFAFLGSAAGMLIGGSFTTLADGMSGAYGPQISDRNAGLMASNAPTSQSMPSDANMNASSDMSSANPTTNAPANSTVGQTVNSAVRSVAPGATASPDDIRRATSRAALFSFIALVIGAVAAWFGGRNGIVDPTITVNKASATNAGIYQRPV